ncbi:hypothetical protein BCR32DRAFT_330134 [Anaeromyces robustus]|uniref:Uncharacterized protein n=1 Tax=Anaeromyces robustus TaxID=1754192 RepID=A0A1Y1WA26_9FUNG|nr:hypothetical protein BCR32DRAFT_330134 [Anaeromyces robustus]|eukprot:ORX70400.1 hypothetical protein BCR32DRAFT_330134 [Anaeromyces robustus]
MSNSENLKIISIAKKHQNRIFSYKEKTSKLEQTHETTHIISISNNILMTLYNVITYLSNPNIPGGIENIPSSLLVACWSAISGAYYCLAEGNTIDNDCQNSWINSNQILSSKSAMSFNGNPECNHHFFEGYSIFRMASFELFSLLSHLKSNIKYDSLLKENENFSTKFKNLEKAINQLKQEK